MKIKLNSTHIQSGEEYTSDMDEVYDKPLNNKELILPPNKEYTLVIDYPLSTPAKRTFKSGKNGLSRGKFVSIVRSFYKKVYDIEDGTTKIKPAYIKNMFNRNSTDGAFGIWEHDIGDLVLVNASLSKKNVISLGVDS